jgi:DNA-binding NarL/FixJ family response regulator
VKLRIVVAEDAVLFREGLVRLLVEAGHDVIAAVGDAESLIGIVDADRPDLAIIDVRMPPDLTDDGVRAAQELRCRYPGLPTLLLSQHIEIRRAAELAGEGGFGYLLKDRVLQVDDFLDALQRVAGGGSALDPAVVAALVSPTRLQVGASVEALTERERDVLALVAQGLTNSAVARELLVSERTVETHMRSIFLKLRIPDSGDDHRRVRAVIAYLTD